MNIINCAKAAVAAFSAGLLAAQTAITMSDTTRGWVTVGIAILATVAVYAVPNAPAKPATPSPGSAGVSTDSTDRVGA